MLSSSFGIKDIVFLLRSFHSIHTFVPEALWCCSLQPIILFCQDRVLFLVYTFNRSVVSSAQVLFAFSSLASLFNRSVVRICSSLFLFPHGVLSTLFFFVVFFLSICSTSKGSLVSLVCQRSNLVLPLLFLFRCSLVPSLDLGTRSSCSGGVL